LASSALLAPVPAVMIILVVWQSDGFGSAAAERAKAHSTQRSAKSLRSAYTPQPLSIRVAIYEC
jgi:hypothetical protein